MRLMPERAVSTAAFVTFAACRSRPLLLTGRLHGLSVYDGLLFQIFGWNFASIYQGADANGRQPFAVAFKAAAQLRQIGRAHV